MSTLKARIAKLENQLRQQSTKCSCGFDGIHGCGVVVVSELAPIHGQVIDQTHVRAQTYELGQEMIRCKICGRLPTKMYHLHGDVEEDEEYISV